MLIYKWTALLMRCHTLRDSFAEVYYYELHNLSHQLKSTLRAVYGNFIASESHWSVYFIAFFAGVASIRRHTFKNFRAINLKPSMGLITLAYHYIGGGISDICPRNILFCAINSTE